MGNIKDALRERRGAPRKTMELDIPGLGDEPVILQQANCGDLRALYGMSEIEYGPAQLVRMIIDKDGSRIFGDEETGVFDDLKPEEFTTLLKAANELNGYGTKSEEILKNSKASQNEVFASA